MRAVVTGAAGFIGSTLVDRLLDDGHQVVGLDNFSSGNLANLKHTLDYGPRGQRFTLVPVDIQAPELVDVIVGANPHVIFHLAAQVDIGISVADPQFDARSNVLGTINLCEASRQAGIRRIVYATSAETDEIQAQSVGGSQVYPVSPNMVGKLAGQLYLNAYEAMYGLTPICLALSSVYGPRQIESGAVGLITAAVTALTTDRPDVFAYDGSAAHDYVYVDDVVDAFVRAGFAAEGTMGAYTIGSGQRTAVTQMRELVRAALDGMPEPDFTEHRELTSRATAQKPTTALNDLGWLPTVDLAEGIRRTVRWLRAAIEPESPEFAGV